MSEPAASHQWLDVLHVSNLPRNASQAQVLELFSRHGMVDSVMLFPDRKSHFSKCIGWIYMDNGEAAIGTLDKTEFDGCQIQVQFMGLLFKNEA